VKTFGLLARAARRSHRLTRRPAAPHRRRRTGYCAMDLQAPAQRRGGVSSRASVPCTYPSGDLRRRL